MIVAPSPGKLISATSIAGSFGATVSGLGARAAGEGDGDGAAGGEGTAAGAAAGEADAGAAAGLGGSVGLAGGAAVGAGAAEPHPMAVSRVAALATPPVIYMTRRIMSRRLISPSL